MERVVAYSPDDAEIWNVKEPSFHVQLDKAFSPFERMDFEGRDLYAPDFFVDLSFSLEGIGVGQVNYYRGGVLHFSPHWAENQAATPLGPATLSYRFILSPKAEGQIIPPLELSVGLFVSRDQFPPDQLLEFPTYRKAILGRWEALVNDPELHSLPLVLHRQYVLPEWKEVRTVYLPESPKILSDLRVTFLGSKPRLLEERPNIT